MAASILSSNTWALRTAVGMDTGMSSLYIPSEFDSTYSCGEDT